MVGIDCVVDELDGLEFGIDDSWSLINLPSTSCSSFLILFGIDMVVVIGLAYKDVLWLMDLMMH